MMPTWACWYIWRWPWRGIRQGELVSEETYDARFDNGYDIARKIADALEKEFSITIPESEVNNILLHIKGAKT
ncbi:PRD domain-containing protein [Butyrivibrio sp. FCS014]|uniref:PRD domain-containing protein n=1 Tax=Butyrivibrio sp. FCS014 TaxID=1408304 RepID=UPI000467E600|nr:PRD domain-containing protein [Butyrivibrio sp. FCS014]